MSTQIRISQRIPLSCHNCSQQKIRCDKRLPCSRCRTRGLACRRQQVVRRSRDQELVASEAQPDLPHVSPAYVQSTDTVLQSQNSITEPRGFSDDLATSIEGLAWGRRVHPRFHRGRQGILPATSIPESLSRLLPSTARGKFLVRLHLHHLSWNHNVIHAPTFMAQCDMLFETGDVEHLQWLALYFSVVSVSEWTLENGRHQPSEDEPIGHQSSSDYFDAMREVLHYTKFMEHPHVCAVQAVIVSGMIANVIGKSVLLQTMLHSCIRIAQTLGLHQVEDTGDINREVERRIWWNLVQLDYFGIPYTNSYSIILRHSTTSMPSNSEDQTLEAGVTKSTFTIVMSRIALLLPDLLDGLCSSIPTKEKYTLVMDIDRRMRAVVRSIPSGLLRSQSQNQSHGSEPPWIQLARRTLAISAADKILMIHRPFLLLSFRSPAYKFTKNTCIAAATTILREHQNIIDEAASSLSNYYPIWAHSAFCNAAVIVLGLYILFGKPSASTREQHIGLMLAARQRLLMQRSDQMAKKGVYLIDSMLEQQEGTEGRAVTPERIFERFWALQSLDEDSGCVASDSVSSPIDASVAPQDFTDWFNDVFGY
ncbi:hypothetical protein BJX99DRAFT_262040 [Aspergillus californicus]